MKFPDIGTRPAVSQQTYLDQLGKRLVGHFPAGQVQEILSDYQEQFEVGRERGKNEEALIASMGAPEAVSALLLEENPAARTSRLKHGILWGAVLALCWASLWACLRAYSVVLFWAGSCLFIPLAASALFLLLHGPARTALEREFPPARTASPIPVYCIPFAFAVIYEAAEQILVALVGRDWEPSSPVSIGELNVYFILALELCLVLLTAWLLHKTVSASIRYFPGVIHTVGAMGTLYYSYLFFTSMEIAPLPWSISAALLLRLLPYFVGLAAALAFQRWVDGRRPLPKCFLPKAVTKQGWLHRLGCCLLDWFPAGQAQEILEDYQEQFEVGRERGKREESLINDMGRPEAVVRDLLKEDRTLCHRKTRWLAAPLALSGWLLLRLLQYYEWGSNAKTWLIYGAYGHVTGSIAVLLGAVSLFALLRGRDRAVLEAQFPAERTPTLWVFLPPLAVSLVGVIGGIFLISHPAVVQQAAALGRPLGYLVADFIEFSVLLMVLLVLWALARCFSGSIRYFPAAVHAAGSFAYVLCAGNFISGLDLSYLQDYSTEAVRLFLDAMAPYLTGVLLTGILWAVIWSAGKRKE